MTLYGIGYFLCFIGFSIAIGGGGIPPGGFKKGYELFLEHKELHKEVITPSLDQQGAYLSFSCYKIGGCCIFIGLIFFVLSLWFA